MNVRPGGKQPIMRDGWYMSEGRIRIKMKQPMVFTSGPKKGIAKGLRVVCTERFGEDAVQGKDQAIEIIPTKYTWGHILSWAVR